MKSQCLAARLILSQFMQFFGYNSANRIPNCAKNWHFETLYMLYMICTMYHVWMHCLKFIYSIYRSRQLRSGKLKHEAGSEHLHEYCTVNTLNNFSHFQQKLLNGTHKKCWTPTFLPQHFVDQNFLSSNKYWQPPKYFWITVIFGQ